MLTAQRKTTAAAQRSKASVPQPAAVLPHKPRGAVVANASLGDAAKGMTSAALAAALLLGGAPQPAHAEFNKQAVENVNRSGAEVSKTIQENTPDLPSITGGAVNKAINKVKDTLSYDDNTRGLKQAGEKFTNVLKGGDASSDAKSEQRVSQKSELLDRGVSALPAPSPIADLAVGKQDYSNDYSAALRQEGINAKRGDGLTGAFFNKANNGKIDITKGTYDSVEDAGRDAKANLQRVGDKANDSLGGLKRAADQAADKAKDLVSQAPSGYTVLGDIADAGQDLKNAGRKAADNIGAAGAAAKDYSAELRRVGIEAKRGDGLTGAFRKANNGKIDITKGTYNSIEDAASDAQRGLDRAGSAAQRGLDRATNKAGDVLNVKSNPIDSVKRAADKAADKAKDLVSQAPTGWTYLGDIADAGQDLKNAAGRAADKIGATGSGSKDRSAELRRVGIEAKRGAGLTGAFRNANQGYQSLPEGDADRVLTGGIKDAARQGQRGIERVTEKANVLQNVTDSNPVDSVKRAAGKAADKAKDLVSQAPTGYTVLGDLAEYSGKREDQGPLRPSLPGPSNRSSDGTVTGNSAQSTSDLTQDAKSGFIPTLQKLGGNIKNLTTGPETTTTDALEPVGRAPQLQREVGQGRPRSDLSANELRNDATRNAANNN